MQQKLLLIVSGVAVIAMIGAGVYFGTQSDPNLSPSATSTPTQPTTSTTTKKETNTLEGKPLADFTPTTEVKELQKIDITPGTGEEVKPGDTITAHYTGAVAATGIVFQSSLDMGQPIAFSLNGVIKGWTQGVPGMKVGGKRRLIIPSELAYGANPPSGSGIPANAALAFDIELVKIGR